MRKAIVWMALVATASMSGQVLPSAPQPILLAQQNGAVIAASADASALPLLTRKEAEEAALRNNPHISESRLLHLAQKEVVVEARSAELPALNGTIDGVKAEEGSRVAGYGLTASRLLTHVGAGMSIDQLITDFGRTRNLVAQASLRAKASEQNAEATREDIFLATDVAFYAALEAQATLSVAKSTITARQSVSDQVGALAANKLKSTLDQSFADVNLSQAKLMELDAENQLAATTARLNELMGRTDAQAYQLIDDAEPLAAVPPTAEAVIAQAMQQRPDLKVLQLSHDADVKFSKAQRDQLLPTVSAQGIAGYIPNGSTTYFIPDWYGAVGASMSVPVFEGFKYHAQAKEADLRARASDERTRELSDRIVRDVRTAWLRASTAYQRMGVTKQLLQQSNTALDLAQTRYKLGLSSIVELSQAQLQQTQAQVDDASARFAYEADLATLRFEAGDQP